MRDLLSVKNRPKTLILFASVGVSFLLLQFWLGRSRDARPRRVIVEKERDGRPFLLVIAVLNKITAFERRNAVRSTWMSLCGKYRNNSKVICKFFTDTPEGLTTLDQDKVKNESEAYNDMLFMPFRGALNFSLRLVWILKWATANYKFDFLLRIDDDHFLCLDRLVAELPYRPRKNLYWGYVHCNPRVVRVDEGWLMLTRDLTDEVLSKLNSTLPCHPYGDQAVARWMIDSQHQVKYFYDNERIVHAATSYQEKKFLKPDLCQKYLSLHGSYPNTMKKYWRITQEKSLQQIDKFEIHDIPLFEDECKHSNKIFDFHSFNPGYRYEIKPCKILPTWSPEKGFHSREEDGESPPRKGFFSRVYDNLCKVFCRM